MNKTKQEGRIFLTSIHHSDLTWQYSYGEYDEIREKQLDIVMDFFTKYPEYCFIIDQAYVLQNYLKRNPERLELIKSKISEGSGTLELIGGYCIPDMNLISGESFLRNGMLGIRYYQETFDVTPECASLMDSFGTPMQTPQMLSLLGYRYLAPGRMPNAPEHLDTDAPFVWQGAAKTAVTVVPQGGGVDKSSYLTNVPVIQNEEERFEKTIRELQETTGNVLAYYMSEIQMFDEHLFRHLKEANEAPGVKRKVTFGRLSDYYGTLNEKELPVYHGEFNPIFTGCYTTRIGVKQQIRAAENAMFSTELAAALTGQDTDLTAAWEQLSLGQFHDAACGCHHDVCNTDVMEKLEFALSSARQTCAGVLGKGDCVVVLNPSVSEEVQLVATTADALPAGVPVQRDGERYYFAASLPAHGVETFEKGSAEEAEEPVSKKTAGYVGETDCYTFDFTSPLPVIQSKRYKRSVFGQEKFGEILFRHESGSMWAEVLREVPYGSEYQEEEVCDVSEGALFIKVTTKGAVRPGSRPISGNAGDYWPGFEALSFEKEYLFPRHLPYFKLRVTLQFAGCNTKISLRIPLEIHPSEAKALYDTPFAAVSRKPYFEVPYRYRDTVQTLRTGDSIHARGDFPALHWVDYSDGMGGLSVANNGTPGHHVAGKEMMISLLRSPSRCMDGTMYPQPGAYDNGEHVFEFAFCDHGAGEEETAVSLGAVLNRAPVCIPGAAALQKKSLLRFDQPNIVVSAVYRSEGGLVVRAYEIMGKETRCSLSACEGLTCYEADVFGKCGDVVERSGVLFGGYEVRSFLLK